MATLPERAATLTPARHDRMMVTISVRAYRPAAADETWDRYLHL